MDQEVPFLSLVAVCCLSVSVLCRLAVGALALEASLVGLTWSNEHENEE